MSKQTQTDLLNPEQPIPLRTMDLPAFPINELPVLVNEYIYDVAETTQTSVDMAAVASLAVISLCIQGKFMIEGKKNWIEPLNLYTLVVAPPAERKSAVVSLMSEPIKQYENAENERLAPDIERSKIEKQILLKRKKALESKAVNSRGAYSFEIQAIAEEISEFKEVKPCRLFCDDITPEKLSSILYDNNGRAAILSAEGGIFDILAGRYGNPNIDVFLKAHAGDSIRVDRQNRPSEYIKNPSLTTLIFTQPSVMSSIIENSAFQGRGLCARFLYSIPTSTVGKRKFGSSPIDEKITDYYRKIINLLLDYAPDEPRIISLSPEAYGLLSEFAEKIEPMLTNELSDISDWAGKLVGAVLRISGLLYVAECFPLYHTNELYVDEYTMQSAIIIGEYFLEHAKAAYQIMGADENMKSAEYILQKITQNKLQRTTKTELVRICRRFKSTEQMTEPLKILNDYNYLKEVEQEYSGAGRRPENIYVINPHIFKITTPA